MVTYDDPKSKTETGLQSDNVRQLTSPSRAGSGLNHRLHCCRYRVTPRDFLTPQKEHHDVVHRNTEKQQ